MSLETLEVLLRALPNFNGRILLTLNGESLLLNNLAEYCALTRHHWPKAAIWLITTLNIDRGAKWLADLFAAGLDSLQISCYGYTPETYAAVHGVDRFADVRANIAHLDSVPGIGGKDVRLFVFKDGTTCHSALKDKEAQAAFARFAVAHGVTTAVVRRQHSWQGRVTNNISWNEAAPFPCSVVWGARADHLNVSWEGNVLPCCYFHGDEYVLGNIRKSSLEDIFNGQAWHAFYQAIWERRESELPLCRSCTLVHDQCGNPMELARLAAKDGRRLAGREAWFWGGGEAWRAWREFYRDVRPRAMLMDMSDAPHDVDGIPVRHPNDCLHQDGEKLPLVIFAHPRNSARILCNVRQRYPWLPLSSISIAPAQMSFDQYYELPMEAFVRQLEEDHV